MRDLMLLARLASGRMPRLAGLWCKQEVEQTNTLYIGQIARWSQGLRPGYSGSVRWAVGGRVISSIGYTICNEHQVYLRYRQNGQDLAYSVAVTYSTLVSGGRRPWWVCPTCGRRCGVIYGCARGGPYFVCRICGDLAYSSQHTRIRKWMALGDALATMAAGREVLAEVEAERAQQEVGSQATVGQGGGEPVVKRPRGRPRTKRKYTRHLPCHQ